MLAFEAKLHKAAGQVVDEFNLKWLTSSAWRPMRYNDGSVGLTCELPLGIPSSTTRSGYLRERCAG